MTVTAFALGGMAPARATALGASVKPNWLAAPNVNGPCVALYSDTLNRWSDPFYDDGSLAPGDWASDVIFAADTADQSTRTIQTAARSALTTNQTFLGLASPSNAQVLAQTRALTRQMNGVIRLLLGELNSTAGT